MLKFGWSWNKGLSLPVLSIFHCITLTLGKHLGSRNVGEVDGGNNVLLPVGGDQVEGGQGADAIPLEHSLEVSNGILAVYWGSFCRDQMSSTNISHKNKR